MPPLFRKKVLGEANNTSGYQRDNQSFKEKRRHKFKTPLLTKANLENFLRHDIGINNVINKITPDGRSSRIQHTTQNWDRQRSFDKNESLENINLSANVFDTSSSSQISMNKSVSKEAYLNVSDNKPNDVSTGIITPPNSSFSSQYSMNDPLIKQRYLDFLESSQEKREKARKAVIKNKETVIPEDEKQPQQQKLNSKSHNVNVKTKNRNGEKLTSKKKRLANNNLKSKISKRDFEAVKYKKDKPLKKRVSKDKEASKKVRKLKHENKTVTQDDEPVFRTHKEKMARLLETRNVGIYVFCDHCDKMRYLEDVKDPLELPDKWYCEYNADENQNACSIPGAIIPEEEEWKFIENLYNAGSIVWGHLEGYPWWPAMIDDCPDTETYYWLDTSEAKKPSWYHVTYFDTKRVTRSWLKVKDILPFVKYSNPNGKKGGGCAITLSNRLQKSIEMAQEACRLPLMKRLEKYSFIYRYNKPITPPKSLSRITKAKLNIGDKITHKKRKSKQDNKKENKTKSEERKYTRIMRYQSSESADSKLSTILDFNVECDEELEREISIEELF